MYTSFTDKKREEFISILSETCNVSLACRTIGITRRTAYNYKEKDSEFSKAWDEAIENATDLLEFEARRRALSGTLKPVFYQGQEVGKINEYSDTLMIVLLKAYRGEKFAEQLNVKVNAELEKELNKFYDELESKNPELYAQVLATLQGHTQDSREKLN